MNYALIINPDSTFIRVDLLGADLYLIGIGHLDKKSFTRLPNERDHFNTNQVIIEFLFS